MASEWTSEQDDEEMPPGLPQAVEAEQALLGSLLIDPSQVPRVLEMLTEDEFYLPQHRVVFGAMRALHARQQPIDLVLLVDWLGQEGQLEDAGGISGVSALATTVPHSHHAPRYAALVHATAVRRRVLHATADIASAAYSLPDTTRLRDIAARALLDAFRDGETRESQSLADALTTWLQEQEAAHAMGRPLGRPTGFRLLDAHLGGVRPGELLYLAGRSGSGKSALALTMASAMAEDLAKTGDGCVLYVTLEMRATQMAARLLAAAARVDSRVLRANFYTPEGAIEQEAFEHVAMTAKGLAARRGQALRFHAHPVTFERLRGVVQRAVLEHDCRAVFVDYLGLLRPEDRRQTEYQRISDTSRALKDLALEMDLPIVCLVQMNRDAEKRANRRPTLADLRDSGQIEQDGDTVLGIYRGAMYLPQMALEDERFAEFAELSVLKAREGVASVVIPLRFEGPYTRFAPWPADWPHESYLRLTVAEGLEAQTTGASATGHTGHRRRSESREEYSA